MFHLKNGFFYERTPEGIHVVYAMTVDGSPKVVGEVTVSEAEWASVVASTSARGETRSTWDEAREFLSTEGVQK